MRKWNDFLFEKLSDDVKIFYQTLFIKTFCDKSLATTYDTWYRNLIKRTDWLSQQKMITMQIDSMIKWWEESTKGINNLLDVRKLLLEYCICYYFQTYVSAAVTKNEKFKPFNLSVKWKDVFSKNDDKEFIRILPAAVNSLLIQEGTNAGISVEQLNVFKTNKEYFPLIKEEILDDTNKSAEDTQKKIDTLIQKLTLYTNNDWWGKFSNEVKKTKK